jgi:hypothetical protein
MSGIALPNSNWQLKCLTKSLRAATEYHQLNTISPAGQNSLQISAAKMTIIIVLHDVIHGREAVSLSATS